MAILTARFTIVTSTVSAFATATNKSFERLKVSGSYKEKYINQQQNGQLGPIKTFIHKQHKHEGVNMDEGIYTVYKSGNLFVQEFNRGELVIYDRDSNRTIRVQSKPGLGLVILATDGPMEVGCMSTGNPSVWLKKQN